MFFGRGFDSPRLHQILVSRHTGKTLKAHFIWVFLCLRFHGVFSYPLTYPQMPLSDIKVKSLKADIKPDGTVTSKLYKVTDERGLYLEVK